MVHTVQTADLYLPRMGRIPKMHSWIENKIMFRLLLCILGLFLPPNFTLSVYYSGLGVTAVRIQHVEKFNLKNFGESIGKKYKPL
jgi:hypothetical protein